MKNVVVLCRLKKKEGKEDPAWKERIRNPIRNSVKEGFGKGGYR